jgi:alpha-tubulin suppressor-like RCC1 family protein
VALGWNAGCSLDSLAVAYCWGDNSVGELGRAGIPVALGPARVETSLRFATLAVGGSHACGLTAGGASYCWGFNNRGQLGAGALPAGCGSSCSITALAVTGGHSFTALTTGVYHTCGLIADGSAYCWGENGEGQLGTGSVSAGPVSSPQAVAGGLHFKAISAGEFHTCAVTLARAAYCWGANFADQLGIGPSDQTPRLAPQVVVGGLAFDSITSGQAHSCALQSPGAAYCWGIDRGALGTGTTSPGSQSAPVPVTGGLAFVQLTAGTDQSCGRVSDGTVYCWGSGPTTGTGALTAGVVSAPTLVADTLKFAHLAASKLATCGVTVARAVYCWGTPPLLGTADTTVAHRPRRVEGQ